MRTGQLDRSPLGEGGERLFAWYSGGDTEYRLPDTEMVCKVSLGRYSRENPTSKRIDVLLEGKNAVIYGAGGAVGGNKYRESVGGEDG